MNLIANHINTIFENAITYVIVLAMFAYGFGKLVQFNGAVSNSLPVSEMTGMQLMWAFYGYSRPFVLILGALEITGGILMFFPRTRLIGCLFVSTILVNIILQDIFYEVNVGALRAAILYQLLIIIILFIHRIRVMTIWRVIISRTNNASSWRTKALITILSVVAFVVFRVAEYYITMKW
jgi:hypothetical protein